MLPVIALVGRPNVGKSTLFNRLTRSRDALVADLPGLTRDRKYGEGKLGERPYLVIDTGGLSGEAAGIDVLMAQQSWQAVEEADAVIFLVEAHSGVTPTDQQIAERLRRTHKPVYLAVNKVDGADPDTAVAEFYALGLGQAFPLSAVHGHGVHDLIDPVLEALPEPAEETPDKAADDSIRIALVGRPNVGKSTLLNRILGEERVVAFDQPGTTRDSILVPFERDGQPYTLIDTAGVRRRSRIDAVVEKFSVIKALKAMEAAHVVILVLDAHDGITDQDATLAGLAADSGRALVIAINKWDGLETDMRDRIRSEVDRRLPFVNFAEFHYISALHGTNVGHLFEAVQRCYQSATAKFSTPELTRMLEVAVHTHQPPLVRGRRIKLRYAHQGGHNPPLIVIHGNQTQSIPDAYKRYLVNFFRTRLQLVGTPIRLEFRTGENPYKDKRNKLTPRQQHKRKRLMKKVKSSAARKKRRP
ncbi:ribosome biogenesis GTPase Der [Thiohalobacter thiocyanaticus]|uniref:GTPase Der n=1 Tax=Thiohalobacter thiocyanaticus TaxID=585455 RepID=A0A426QH62_9GAMM|nr:ribosome biogenesis GTPase Der [Thiohalobacter thiocyanaticus]RRQ21084.1 ribosome biogenesis GTPase Der [Thiohalobacter thiocyanaticus]